MFTVDGTHGMGDGKSSCHPSLRIGGRALIHGCLYIYVGLASSRLGSLRSLDPAPASRLRSERIDDVHLQPHH
jgi:hypothetical protein